MASEQGKSKDYGPAAHDVRAAGYERIAMCAHPEGTHEHVPLKPGEDPPETCFADCDCNPVVFVRADAAPSEDRYERVKTPTALDLVLKLAHLTASDMAGGARETARESIAIVRAHRDALRESLSNG
jgi:hypothetical protein